MGTWSNSKVAERLGTLFAPVEDRDIPGRGFTDMVGDVVTISSGQLGALVNTVPLSTECPPGSSAYRI
jgi:fumarylacetoacetate (FAA) hydrolase family protein